MDYNEIAYSYISEERIKHPFRKKAYQEWLLECNKVSWKRALDLGCGGGISTRFLAKIGYFEKIIGIDNSEKLVKEALKDEFNFPLGIDYCIKDIFLDWENVFSPDYIFDLIASFAVFHYADSEKQLENLFIGVNRITSQSSRLISVLLDPEEPVRELIQNASSYSRWIDSPFQNGSKIETTLLGSDGQEICKLENFYWPKSVYERLLGNCGFPYIEWKKPEYIGKMGLVLLTARKGS